jgi:hypothetical protein
VILARRFLGPRARWGLLGLYLMLWAGPVGDAKHLLSHFLLGGSGAGSNAFALDLVVGRLVLFLGWCCIAWALGGAPNPATASAGGFSRLALRLRWLPVPMLATTGLYLAVALRKADAQLLVVDVSNAPPGAKLLVGGDETVLSRDDNLYVETIEHLFGVPLPGGGRLPNFARAHAEFHSEPTRLGLQNWRPEWTWLFVTSQDEGSHQGLVVFLNLHPCAAGPDVIDVGGESAVACVDWYDHGRCVVQNAHYRRGAQQIRVNVDLTGVQPAGYEGEFPPGLHRNLGAKWWPPCPSAG